MNPDKWQVKKGSYNGDPCWVAFKIGEHIQVCECFEDAVDYADVEARTLPLVLPPVGDWWSDNHSLDIGLVKEGIQITGPGIDGEVSTVVVPYEIVEEASGVLLSFFFSTEREYQFPDGG